MIPTHDDITLPYCERHGYELYFRYDTQTLVKRNMVDEVLDDPIMETTAKEIIDAMVVGQIYSGSWEIGPIMRVQ